jgi:hypothetical protein
MTILVELLAEAWGYGLEVAEEWLYQHVPVHSAVFCIKNDTNITLARSNYDLSHGKLVTDKQGAKSVNYPPDEILPGQNIPFRLEIRTGGMWKEVDHSLEFDLHYMNKETGKTLFQM